MERKLTDEERRKLEEAANWVVRTCLMFGCEPGTAYKVAGLFVEGVAHEWRRQAS